MTQSQITGYRNGADMPSTSQQQPQQPQQGWNGTKQPQNVIALPDWLGPWKLTAFALAGVAMVFAALLGSGWILNIAKDRDLRDLAGKVEDIGAAVKKSSDRVEAAFDKMTTKLERLEDGQRMNREEIIRLGGATTQGLVASPPSPPPAKTIVKRRVSKSPPRPEEAQAAQSPTILQKLFQ